MTSRLYLGDCLEIMKKIPNASVDCFVCDLPYGQLSLKGTANLKRCEPGREHEPRHDNTNVRGCAWDVKINLEQFWEQVKRIRKNKNTPVLMFCNTRFGYELIKSNESWFRYDLVWDKERGVSFLLANKMPMKAHEMIYVFSEEGSFYNRIDMKGEFKSWKSKESKENKHTNTYATGMPNGWIDSGNDGTSRCITSVIRMKKKVGRDAHPTEKSVEMYKWLIERYCPAEGTILDPTAGSFNSCLAAMELERNAIGIEKDKGFYEKAVKKFSSIHDVLQSPPSSNATTTEPVRPSSQPTDHQEVEL